MQPFQSYISDTTLRKSLFLLNLYILPDLLPICTSQKLIKVLHAKNLLQSLKRSPQIELKPSLPPLYTNIYNLHHFLK